MQHYKDYIYRTESLSRIFFQTLIIVSREKSLFIIWTSVLQDTQTIFTLLEKMAAGCYFELVWKVTAPLERQEREYRVERWPAQHTAKRAKRSVVAEHKTLAGMYCWIVAWREGATDPSTDLCASTRILNLIQAAMGSWMHTLALSGACLCALGARLIWDFF